MKSLGERMKEYEAVSKSRLLRRCPVIIRIDGCHFHTFTKGFDKPFDELFMESMISTTKRLCEEIQGCVLGYTQSDEISLVLCDYKNLDTAAWFDNQVQKICSVSAALATMIFNEEFSGRIMERRAKVYEETMSVEAADTFYTKYIRALLSGAYFDSRCFNLLKEEVCNYLIWRQQDAERNSILGLAQSMYSHSELHGISCKKLQDKMFTENGVNWNDIDSGKKRGVVIAKPEEGGFVPWPETPIFSQNRDFVERRITF